MGKPFRFRTLGVAVLDGVVYVTRGTLRPLGPLNGAIATVKPVAPRIVRRSTAVEVIDGGVKKIERVLITVETSKATHSSVV